MNSEAIKTWMRDNKARYENAAELAGDYCAEHDALDSDGDVPDGINTLASEVWDETDDDSDVLEDEDDSDDDSEEE